RHRGHRKDPGGQRTGAASAPAALPVRHHAGRIAVRPGRNDPLPGPFRARTFPRRLRPGQVFASGRQRRLTPEPNMLETIVQRERDFGTPASLAAETVALVIDGVECSVPAGTSVMRAAAIAGINIPKLCATDSLEAFGSCRLCLVEIEGRRGYPASCTTPVEAGMV